MPTAVPFYIQESDPAAKQEILKAALKLFSEQGLAATTIRDIAEQSGYTNPALYKHFQSKEELALHLFETCHRRMFTLCSEALASSTGAQDKLSAYVGCWLELADEYPDVIAFLSDSARVLWPKASAKVRRQTMNSLARSVVAAADPSLKIDHDAAAASLQGTLAELARMIQVGAVKGPATRWKDDVTAILKRLLA